MFNLNTIIMATQRVALGRTGQAIIISDITFDKDGFATGQKSAIVPIDPMFDPKEMLEKAKLKQWELYGEPNLAGFVSAKIVGEVDPNTIVDHGRSASHELIASDEVLQEIASEGSTNTPDQRGKRI